MDWYLASRTENGELQQPQTVLEYYYFFIIILFLKANGKTSIWYHGWQISLVLKAAHQTAHMAKGPSGGSEREQARTSRVTGRREMWGACGMGWGTSLPLQFPVWGHCEPSVLCKDMAQLLKHRWATGGLKDNYGWQTRSIP